MVLGDFDEPDSLSSALEGVDAALLVTPVAQAQERQERSFVDAARHHGRARIVKVAAYGFDRGIGRLGTQHAHVVESLHSSGLPHAVLAPTIFMQNLLRMAGAVRETGMLAMPCGTAAVNQVDARDVAAVAVALLTGESLGDDDGRVVPVTGPQSLTYDEVAVGLSRLVGRDVRYVDVEVAEARQALLARGTGPWVADGLIELYAASAEGRFATVTDDVRRLTGRSPGSFETFLDEHRAAFEPR